MLRGVMWTGRFSQPTADLVLEYGESVSYDWKLYEHDIAGSTAHARAQLKAGMLTQEEFDAIANGLQEILADIKAGNFQWSMKLEDVHMNIESELTRRIGAPGAKLHTARSRNDQVATDTRLYCRAQIDTTLELLKDMQRALVQKAAQYAEVRIPGYTHLQRAQPVTVGHHLLAYVEMLDRDRARLEDCRRRVNVSPLGSGAIAGSTINLDRAGIAAELGFDSVSENSMDAIADRDYIMETLFDLSIIGTHLSRLSEDLVLWSSSEFGYCTLSDAHTTGSSLMPQKKNPDVCELTRGKSGRLYGNLVSVMVAVKGLPLTYNRDLQEDKEGFLDADRTVDASLMLMAGMLEELTFRTDRMRAACARGFLNATELADYLVGKGLPFREAHHVTGHAVALAEKQGKGLEDLSLAELQQLDARIADDVYAVLDYAAAVRRRETPAGTGPRSVARQIEQLRSWLQERA